MAKARPVPGVKPRASFRENACRILAVRLDEVTSRGAALDDASQLEALHALRIAAKRLRYALEMFESCFPGAGPYIERLSALQDAIGEVHDLDVLVELMRSRLRNLYEDAEATAVEIMADKGRRKEKMARLRQTFEEQAQEASRIGLLGLIGSYLEERRNLYARLQADWQGSSLSSLGDHIKHLMEADHVGPDRLWTAPS